MGRQWQPSITVLYRLQASQHSDLPINVRGNGEFIGYIPGECQGPAGAVSEVALPPYDGEWYAV